MYILIIKSLPLLVQTCAYELGESAGFHVSALLKGIHVCLKLHPGVAITKVRQSS